jgi:outer membrane immunogenic protein
MKRLILGVAAALLLSAGPAIADGMPTKGSIKSAPAAAGPNWNGFYLGVGIGAGALVGDKPDYNYNGYEFANYELGGDGVFGTVTVGYDRVIRPGWVAGVFADFDFGSGISSDSDFWNGRSRGEPNRFSLDHDHSWAIGARLGFLTAPGTLVYGTAGYTQMEIDADSPALGLSHSTTFDGYFVGAGLETFLRDNWTLKLEYRYSNFGSETLLSPSEGPFGVDFDPSMHTARLVLSYKFGHPHD